MTPEESEEMFVRELLEYKNSGREKDLFIEIPNVQLPKSAGTMERLIAKGIVKIDYDKKTIDITTCSMLEG